MNMNYYKGSLADMHRSALGASDLITPSTKVDSDFTVNLRCPGCGKVKMSVHANDPRRGFCWRPSCEYNRENGIPLNLTEYFGLTIDYEMQFPSSKSNPTRSIDEWLINERKIPREILDGVKRKQIPDARNSGSIAAMFFVGIGTNGEETWNGRIINPPSGENKGHGWGKQESLYGTHTGREINPYEEVWVVEGAINCLSLWAMDTQSIYVFSANTNPRAIDVHHFKKLILLFDNDKNGAGQKCMKRFLEVYPGATPMLLSPGMDANDILRKYGPKKGAEYIDSNRELFKCNAALTLAGSPQEYARLFFEYHHKSPKLFTFAGSSYFGIYIAKEERMDVELVGHFLSGTISYRKQAITRNQDEYKYHIKVTPRGNTPKQAIVSAGELSTSARINETLLRYFQTNLETNKTQAIKALTGAITRCKNAPVVSTPSTIGYDPDTGWYLFHGFAVSPQGKVLRPDKNGFYRADKRNWLAAPEQAAEKALIPSENGLPISQIHQLISDAWGPRGLTALAWCTASLFCLQVKSKIDFFPFLSLWGEVQSAKSSLTLTLARMQGFNEEGTGTSALNSKAGISEVIRSLSNLFHAILEGNERDQNNVFIYDALLPLFNSTTLRKLRDKDNTKFPFYGSLMFTANEEVWKNAAERERVISIEFRTEYLTDSTREAADKLAEIPLQELARTIMVTLSHRKQIEEEWHDYFSKACEDLSVVSNRRIRECHAICLGFHRIFCKVHGVKNSRLKEYIEEIAKLKEITATEREHTIADDFFEKLSMIPIENQPGCLHKDTETGLIYFSSPKVEHYLRGAGFNFSTSKQLFDALRRYPGFVKSSVPFRFPDDPEKGSDGRPKLKKVWIFDARKMPVVKS